MTSFKNTWPLSHSSYTTQLHELIYSDVWIRTFCQYILCLSTGQNRYMRILMK